MDYKIYSNFTGGVLTTVYGFHSEDSAIRYAVKKYNLRADTIKAVAIKKDAFKEVNYK